MSGDRRPKPETIPHGGTRDGMEAKIGFDRQDRETLWAALVEIEKQGCPTCAGLAAVALDHIRRRSA